MVFSNPDGIWYFVILAALLLLGGGAMLYNRRFRWRFANAELYERLTDSVSNGKRVARSVFFVTGLVFLVLAIMRPRFGTKTEIVKQMGVDVAIALDTSHSMLAEDVRPNRIRQARYEIHRFINVLKGDRVGLIAFAGDSFVQCPLTVDYGAAKTLLDNIDVGIIPKPGTNLASAIDRAVELLEEGGEGDAQSRVIVLVTDGENLEGNVSEAAKRAAAQGITIFTVGIGTTGGEIIPIRDNSGGLEDYKKDEQGNIVRTALDETTLRTVAHISGGDYLRTAGGETDLDTLISHIGTMQDSGIHERKISRMKEQYQLPLGISLACLLVWTVVDERRKSSGQPRRNV